VSACNHGVISIGEQINTQGYYVAVFNDPDSKCKGCRLCGEICPDVAIEVYKE
jgi:2-oxoglutarate ferredoxin oxidoreductase subunit delta